MRKTMLYDVMQERGCFMAKTDTQVSLRVTSQFKARLERQAERERRSVSNLILKVMEEYLERQRNAFPAIP